MDYKAEKDPGARCLQCGTELYGRPDKKFCSDPCKNKWHNSRGGEKRRSQGRVFTDLAVNYDILEKLLLKGVSSVDRSVLENMGFRCARITGHRRIRGGHDEYQCFDIHYIQTETRLFRIRRVSAPLLETPSRQP
ncbi:MAG: hypothetical protein IJV01_04980 [Bacteroidales bacterium]|nr:hypothetical protein [Bacteroidales bacterium]